MSTNLNTQIIQSMTSAMVAVNDEYEVKLLTKRFGNKYVITKHTTKQEEDNAAATPATTKATKSSYILKPKNNPSLLKATIFPMHQIRYKYKVTFHYNYNQQQHSNNNKIEDVTYEDMNAITFNRANGSTPEQQNGYIITM